MSLIYLDNHATTRCDPAVLEAMWPWFAERYGNAASRSHRLGIEARRAVEGARGQVAAWLGVSPKEVVFTSGATEANNLALLGVIRASGAPCHAITLATEHSAVLDPLRHLARAEGLELTVLPVDGQGLVDPGEVVAAMRPHTRLVSVMRVNNEIGTIQPLAPIGAACRERGVLLHTDAAQASCVPMDRDVLNVDLISVSGHKIYGPAGIGALVVRRTRPRIALQPLQFGGGHERGLRSGTLPVPLVVGLGAAAERIRLAEGEAERIGGLRDRLLAGILAGVSGVTVNGTTELRSPNNLNLTIDGIEASALLVGLRDQLCLSTGSACASEALAPSHVLAALGISPEAAGASIRFGLGRSTTTDQIDAAVAALVDKITEIRTLASLYEA